jgi:hypothetical protein
MANVNDAVKGLYGEQIQNEKKDRRMTQHSRKWSSSGLGLDAAEAEARRLEKKGTFTATMDDEANTVTLSKDDFKAVMGKLGGHKQVAKRSQSNLILLAFGYLAVSIGFIAVIVGLMNWRIEASKESHVKGAEMVGKDGEVIKTADLINFASIFDLTKLSPASLVQVKHATLQLENGKDMAFEITGATKLAGSKSATLLTPGGVILINGESMQAAATVNGVCFKVKSPDQATRRVLASGDRKLLHAHADYFTAQSNGRSLSETNTGGFAGLAIALGKELKDELDAKDPVSGTLTWGPAMRVKFALNYERIPGIGFDEKCMHSPYEVRRRPGNYIMHMQAGGVDIVMSNTIMAEGKIDPTSGQFNVTKCSYSRRDNLFEMSSDTLKKDDASLQGMFDFSSATNYSFPAEVSKDQQFAAVDIDIAKISDECLKHDKSTSRRLKMARENSHQHFVEMYHTPLMAHNAETPRHLWTAEHQTHHDALSLINDLYEQTTSDADGRNLRARKLGETDASKAMDDVYNTANEGQAEWATCVDAKAWATAVAGQACYLKRGCMFAFRGSDDNGDWSDNIIGSLSIESHNGYWIHKGFINQLKALRSQTSLDSEASDCGHSAIWVGHSLGGAMSYAARGYYNKGSVNNYAAPAAYWNAGYRGFSGARTWHENDPVPYLTNAVGYQHVFGSRSLYEKCSAYHRRCPVPYPCSCGWRGCNTCWGGCFNGDCKTSSTAVRGNSWNQPKLKWASLAWDVFANILNIKTNDRSTHFHDQGVYYRPNGA